MKNIIIIIGTILLGVVIVNNFVLGDTNSLKKAAEDVVKSGATTITESFNQATLNPLGGTGGA